MARSAIAKRVTTLTVRLSVCAVIAVLLGIIMINAIRNPVDSHSTGREYHAIFDDVSGLHENGDVRVRGVRVGKVTSVKLEHVGEAMKARVSFTMAEGQKITQGAELAVKYANLSGVRYLDVTNVGNGGPAIYEVPVDQTVPSFDITTLFNGLEPALQTLSPQEVNQFSENAITLLQGDGGGFTPLINSIDRLSEFAQDRERVMSVLVDNLARIADTLGGRAPQIISMLRSFQRPVDAANTVLDEFRKTDLYGPTFTHKVNEILSGVGIEPDTDIDRVLSEAFPALSDLTRTLGLLPVIADGLKRAGQRPSEGATCSHGTVQLPQIGQVLTNGSGVVICVA